MDLNFKKFGSGKTIIILHGLFGMLDNWKSFARKLAENYEVIILDQRDHGRSPHTEAFNYQLLASDIKQFIDEQNISLHALIGDSMGGKAAMQFCHDYPGELEKLVVVDIGPLQNPENHLHIFKALKAVPIDQLSSRSDAEDILSQHIEESSVRLFLMKNLTRTLKSSYKWKMNLDLIIENYDEILAEIPFDYPMDMDGLFIKGDRSNYINQENIDRIHEVFINSDIITIPDAGHWVNADQPEILLEKINDFLAN